MTINERNIIKYTAIRKTAIERELSNTANDGARGRAFELMCARSASHKTCVAKQGKTDVSVRVVVNNKVKYLPAECKTNGGRVNDLLDGSNKSRFVIYKLDFVQKHKATKKAEAWEEVRSTPALLIPTDLFTAMLIDCNAIKEIAHGGIVDGVAIQPSSKRMFERLMAYAENFPDMKFSPETDYEDWMFEGLEL
jgi:hypothetical protein